jgi:protein involved in polysaccharide export with SLBB domain
MIVKNLKAVFFLILFVCLSGYSNGVKASPFSKDDILSALGGGSSGAGQDGILGLGTEALPTMTPVESMFALDEPINPDEYYVGPGDVLGLSLRGSTGLFIQTVITPEGKLLVADMPMLQVNGKSLTEVIDLIHSEWGIVNGEQKTIDVALLQLRQVRVSIGGAVSQSGQYVVTSADRASTLIELAGGLLAKTSSIRRATLYHLDGSSDKVDLLRFSRSGNFDCNPRLKSGDHLVVENRNHTLPTIDIDGGVVAGGSYEWVKGDRVLDLVEVAGGLTAEAIADSIILTHFDSDGWAHSSEINLLQIMGKSERGPELAQGDIVFVKMKTNMPYRATIILQGEVNYPGIYPVVIGETKLSEVIQAAGGFTKHAFLKGARMWKAITNEDVLDNEGERLDSLEALLYSDMDKDLLRVVNRSLSRDYIQSDFVDIFENNNSESDIILNDNFVVDVPREQNMVLVVGQVRNPGYYQYSDGENFKYYVNLAGGYAGSSIKSQTRLIKYRSSVWAKPKGFSIDAGDMIFVPERELRSSWDQFKDVFGVVTQAATVLLLIITTTK